MKQAIDISTTTFLRAALVVLGLWFLFTVRDILVLLFIVVIIVTALTPTVDRWAKYLTRPGAVVSVFLLVLVVLTGFISLVLPPLVDQLQQFGTNLPTYADNLSRSNSGLIQEIAQAARNNINSISSQLGNLGSLLFTQTLGFISGIAAVITVIILTFYLLLEEEGLKKIYKGLLTPTWHEALAETTRKIAVKLGAWMRGQLLLMLAVGILTTVGLLAVGSPYALSLGIWSALTEVIPIVGPWLGAVPGVAVGLAESPIHGFVVLLVYLVVQQVENSFLVPRIMAKAVGLNPFIVILAILLGGKVYGLMGVLLSVPAAAVIGVLAEDWPVIRETFQQTRK